MIEKISRDSFTFRELIDFWKLSVNLPVDFIIFNQADSDNLRNSLLDKKTVAFFRSHSQKEKFMRIDVGINSIIRDSLKSRLNIDVNNFNLITKNIIYHQNSELKPGFNQKNYAISTSNLPIIYQSQENLLIFGIDLEEILEDYLLNKINQLKPAIYSHLPFNYRLLPSFLKKIYLKLKKRSGSIGKNASDSSIHLNWPEDYTIDILRYVFLASMHEFLNMKIPYISVWPVGISSPFLISFDFDSKDSFLNFPSFLQEYETNIKPTIFVLADKSNRFSSGKILNESTTFGLEIGSHGYNHDGKLIFLNKKELDKRFNEIKSLFKTKFGFRNEQLFFDIEFLKKIQEYLLYDSSISNTMFDVQGIRGCGTIFPYFLTLGDNILEIPLTIPMEFEFQFKGIDINESIEIVTSKIRSIIKMKGIINGVFHPEKSLSANSVWRSFYTKYINLMKDNARIGDCSIISYQDLLKIWTQRMKLFLKQDGNELYISYPTIGSMETNESEIRYRFEINYF